MRSAPVVPVIELARSSPAVPGELSPKRRALPFAKCTLDVASCAGIVLSSVMLLPASVPESTVILVSEPCRSTLRLPAEIAV